MNGREMVELSFVLLGYCLCIVWPETGPCPSQNRTPETSPRKSCSQHFGVCLKLAGEKINFRTTVLKKKG